MFHKSLKHFLLFLALATSAPVESLLEFSHQVQDIDSVLESLTRNFEIAAASSSGRNKEKLEAILTEAKDLSTNISTVQYDLKEALATLTSNHHHAFRERLLFELTLIEVNAKARQLRTVQHEILGITNGVSNLPNYRFSERITLTANYLRGRFDEGFSKLAEVDQLLEEVMNKARNTTTPGSHHSMDAKTKEKIVKLLKEFISETSSVKKELELQYYGVVEEMRLKGEELGLHLRFTFEAGIDYVNFALAFAGQNLEFIQKFASYNLLMMFNLMN